jgi:RimJ/RimL family protein N-acetyltransferase
MKMPITIYENKTIMLCPLSMDLIESVDSDYYQWFMDEKATRFNSHGLWQMSDQDFEDYFKAIDNREALVWAIINKSNNKHIGNVSLQSFNYVNRSCEMAILIGETGYHGKGIATQAIEFLYDHAFRKMNLHRIWSGTAATNIGMLNVFKKLGMKKEAEFRDATYLDGEYIDIHGYGILKSEWIEKINE